MREHADNQHKIISPDPRYKTTLTDPLMNKRTWPGRHNGKPDTECGAQGNQQQCAAVDPVHLPNPGKCKFLHPKDKNLDKYTKSHNCNARRARGGP